MDDILERSLNLASSLFLAFLLSFFSEGSVSLLPVVSVTASSFMSVLSSTGESGDDGLEEGFKVSGSSVYDLGLVLGDLGSCVSFPTFLNQRYRELAYQQWTHDVIFDYSHTDDAFQNVFLASFYKRK